MMKFFEPFPKVPRLARDCIITEKIDGTNASVWVIPQPTLRPDMDNETSPYGISEEFGLFRVLMDNMMYVIRAGSRTRFLEPNKQKDNMGFCRWVQENKHQLVNLGEGVHYGEWWGQKIQRNYGLTEKRFSLFNTGRWLDPHIDPVDVHDGEVQSDAPACCHVVPVLYRGRFTTYLIEAVLDDLRREGSVAAPGFDNPEGVMIFHTAANSYFKKTIENDEKPKSA